MFQNPANFQFTECLTAHWQTIRDEYLSLPQDAFDPWVQRDLYGEGWSVFGLFALGKRIKVACDRCPQTAQILENIPDLTLAGFSRLAPHTHIQPHTGWAKNEFRLHLGLVAPPQCKLRVGKEIEYWKEGHCLIFEDTTEHEAWNDAVSERAVLLLDFVKPGLEHPSEEISEYALNYAMQLLEQPKTYA
jgi:ornithine lipid ester-linked acyl 2-hydroxylase